MIQARGALAELRDAQEASLQEAVKVKQQFEALSSGVSELAAAGNGQRPLGDRGDAQ